MPAYFTVRELKAVRAVYGELKITNSAVLDRINTIITMSHFGADDIFEVLDILGERSVDPKQLGENLESAIKKAQLIDSIQKKAQSSRSKGKDQLLDECTAELRELFLKHGAFEVELQK